MIKGNCSCGDTAYILTMPPLFVHACHCLDCKRKAGSSFALTCIVIESDIQLHGTLSTVRTSPRSTAHKCANCDATLYVTSKAFPVTALLQTNTIEDLRQLEIGAHIWVKRKDPCLELPAEVPQFDEGYERDFVWPQESLHRLATSIEQMP